MSVNKTADPAGLLGDHVHIELDGALGDFDALAGLLKSNTPRARIERLSKSTATQAQAAELSHWLKELGGVANAGLLAAISSAEHALLYARAAPLAKTGRKVRKPFKVANNTRKDDAAARHARWQALAAPVWKRNPRLSASAVARQIAKADEKPNTIRRVIHK